ncbi:MAG: class I SAM-dependent methyltransferase, partial [Rhodothermales bacterium]
MYYDPIKDRLGRAFSANPFLQKTFYSLLHVVFLRSWYVRREIRRLLEPYSADERIDVLDAGTGFGQYAYYVAREFPNARVLAVDVKEDYLENARRFVARTPQRNRISFEKHDLTDLHLNRSFDLILSVDVMEHIEDDGAVFRNFARVLKSGGHVIINTPSNLGGSDVSGEGEESFIEEHVRPGYSREELTGKLEDAGLAPVRAFYTYGGYGSKAWRILLKWPMQMLARTRAAFAILPIYYLLALPAGAALNALDVRTENTTGTGLLVGLASTSWAVNVNVGGMDSMGRFPNLMTATVNGTAISVAFTGYA